MQEFKKIKTENEELGKLQDNLIEFFTNFKQSAQILDGVLLKDISLKSGANSISHKLNRQLTGYIVVKKNANVNVWDSGADTKLLNLQTSAATTVSLWVF